MLRWISRIAVVAMLGGAMTLGCASSGGTSTTSTYTGPTTAEAVGTPNTLNESQVRVRVTGIGDINAFKREARSKGAAAVVGSAVKPEAFGHQDWAQQIELHAEVLTRPADGWKAMARNQSDGGGYRLECWVQVNQKALLTWAKERGLHSEGASDMNLPTPQIMLVPEELTGQLIVPGQLSADQAYVETQIKAFLEDPSRQVQISDYTIWYNAVQQQELETGFADIKEFLMDADMYIRYRVSVEESIQNRQTVYKATILVNAVMVTTADSAFNAPVHSETVTDRGAALADAARKAAQQAYARLMDRYRTEYEKGVPFVLMVSKIRSEQRAELMAALEAVSKSPVNELGMAPGSTAEVAARRYRLYVQPDFATSFRLMQGLNDSMATLKVDDLPPSARRFIHFELGTK